MRGISEEGGRRVGEQVTKMAILWIILFIVVVRGASTDYVPACGGRYVDCRCNFDRLTMTCTRIRRQLPNVEIGVPRKMLEHIHFSSFSGFSFPTQFFFSFPNLKTVTIGIADNLDCDSIPSTTSYVIHARSCQGNYYLLYYPCVIFSGCSTSRMSLH